MQYYLRFQNGAINSLIEEAIVQAGRKGVKVISLGLLNQASFYLPISEDPHLKIKVVDGSSLAVAVILNSSPKGTTQVVLRGNLTKVGYAIAYAFSQKGIQNWLPRRVMRAWRIASIVHALEGWKEHDCDNTMSNTEKIWQASLRHGFHPLVVTTQPM
ncbi:hypothetical protein C1H46_005461 [Malus baccata]|uniref:Very-long-chain aldehyde decarbonylase CER1-like C-terminal domain-containing protein n=1 Tax=Malus baccata TaxID=106549 RepID=A0A540NDI3_MALBA|nr:hypothetical protein C1H46_005461 [Malus baccata]